MAGRKRLSKIDRFYWRELHQLTAVLTARVEKSQGVQRGQLSEEDRNRIRLEAKREIEHLHAECPRYHIEEPSDADFLAEQNVQLLSLEAVSAPSNDRKARVLTGGKPVTVEEFVAHYYVARGYTVLPLESRPFHVLFGTFFWLLLQDPSDSRVQIRGFGDIVKFMKEPPDDGPPLETDRGIVWFPFPEDFGVSSYAERRAAAIEEHFTFIRPERSDLVWLFDYWLGPSREVRNYLWARQREDVERARLMLELLPPEAIISVLRFLIGDYWGRYLGWPDLLVYNDTEWFLVEVKGSGDKLSYAQKAWIRETRRELRPPFMLVRVLRRKEATPENAPTPSWVAP